MKKFLIVFMSLFATAPAAARVCMLDNPTIIATQTQLTSQIAALQAQLDAMDTRVDLIENVDLSWLESWSSASDSLAGSTNYVNGQIGAWSVTSNQSGDNKTASGDSMCSSTGGGTQGSKGNPFTSNGQYCWCKMDSPRIGAWAFFSNFGSAADCVMSCAPYCAIYVRDVDTFRAAVLSLP